MSKLLPKTINDKQLIVNCNLYVIIINNMRSLIVNLKSKISNHSYSSFFLFIIIIVKKIKPNNKINIPITLAGESIKGKLVFMP